MSDNDWRYFPCIYCHIDIDTHDHAPGWYGVGGGMSDSYAHTDCTPKAAEAFAALIAALKLEQEHI